MTNRTLHDNPKAALGPTPAAADPDAARTASALQPADTPMVLSTLWITILLANLFRDVHEILRPGFVADLANDGTVYGREVTDGTLLVSGFALIFLVSVITLARVLPRRPNRIVNVVAALMMAGGVLASWPKDPDDYAFGAFQLVGTVVVVAICARWTDDRS